MQREVTLRESPTMNTNNQRVTTLEIPTNQYISLSCLLQMSEQIPSFLCSHFIIWN